MRTSRPFDWLTRRALAYFQAMPRLDVAPNGAAHVFGNGGYKYVAPTELSGDWQADLDAQTRLVAASVC